MPSPSIVSGTYRDKSALTYHYKCPKVKYKEYILPGINKE